MRTLFGEWHLANGAQNSACKLGFQYCLIFGEIEWRFIRQETSDGNFSLGAQSLVKLTPVVKDIGHK